MHFDFVCHIVKTLWHHWCSGEAQWIFPNHDYRSLHHDYCSLHHDYRSLHHDYRSLHHDYRSLHHDYHSLHHDYRSGGGGSKRVESIFAAVSHSLIVTGIRHPLPFHQNSFPHAMSHNPVLGCMPAAEHSFDPTYPLYAIALPLLFHIPAMLPWALVWMVLLFAECGRVCHWCPLQRMPHYMSLVVAGKIMASAPYLGIFWVDPHAGRWCEGGYSVGSQHPLIFTLWCDCCP